MTATAIDAGAASHALVDPSTSVRRKVTVPVGVAAPVIVAVHVHGNATVDVIEAVERVAQDAER